MPASATKEPLAKPFQNGKYKLIKLVAHTFSTQIKCFCLMIQVFPHATPATNMLHALKAARYSVNTRPGTPSYFANLLMRATWAV